MNTLRYFYILLFLAVLVFARQGLGREKTRITDIIPKDSLLNEDKAATGLYLYVFELDRDKYPAVLDVLYDINDLPVEYVNLGSFAGNGLVSCGGDIETWTKLAQILVDSKAKPVKRTIAYINDGINDDIVLAVLDKPGSVSYRQSGSDSIGIGLPAGNVSLRFNTKPLIGLKQIRRVSITPVYKAEIAPDKKQMSGKKQPVLWEFPFSLASLSVSLRPGQFVCIAANPANFPQQGPEAIGQMMFCSNKSKPVIRLCLVACSLIND
ncbi:MAG: hypothetical protein CVV39_00520 [Planctomycetes bacterium HGW-Planctomycetes-1]|nr:MAG: hypothetical protein CVV39_00520 [Planctomycetes bacterium HGW-Planctomycetes-1]